MELRTFKNAGKVYFNPEDRERKYLEVVTFWAEFYKELANEEDKNVSTHAKNMADGKDKRDNAQDL